MFSMIKRAFCGRLNFCVFWLLWRGIVGTVTFVTFVIPPNNAVAQFPGVGSAAPSGVATQADYHDVSPSADDKENSVSDGSKASGASAVSGQLDDDNNDFDYQSSDSRFSTSLPKNEQYRKHLFIKKLRFEFAAIEFVERRTGLPFSRDDVPRYLSELRSDLKTIAAKEEKGAIVKVEVQSVARDAYHIETQLNDYLDQLLDHAGQPVPTKPFFPVLPVLPKTSRMVGQKLDVLALKFELADYGEKALQAMGVKKY